MWRRRARGRMVSRSRSIASSATSSWTGGVRERAAGPGVGRTLEGGVQYGTPAQFAGLQDPGRILSHLCEVCAYQEDPTEPLFLNNRPHDSHYPWTKKWGAGQSKGFLPGTTPHSLPMITGRGTPTHAAGSREGSSSAWRGAGATVGRHAARSSRPGSSMTYFGKIAPLFGNPRNASPAGGSRDRPSKCGPFGFAPKAKVRRDSLRRIDGRGELERTGFRTVSPRNSADTMRRISVLPVGHFLLAPAELRSTGRTRRDRAHLMQGRGHHAERHGPKTASGSPAFRPRP